MTRLLQHIKVGKYGDVCCIRLCHSRLDEPMIYELSDEIRALIEDGLCRKIALSLGPEAPECMYSVFLAKLIALQRILREHQGEMVLCDVNPDVRGIFSACGLEDMFHFVPDFAAAEAYWTK
jgi:anti-anti-sigma factor